MPYFLDALTDNEAVFGQAVSEAVETSGTAYSVVQTVNILTIVLAGIIILANVTAIVLLIAEHKRSKRPKNITERYKKYKITMGTVVSVEKVAYYFKRYVKNEDLDTTDINGKKKKVDTTKPTLKKGDISPVEKYTANEVVYKSPEKLEEEQNAASLEVRKFRYKVFYEFTIPDTGNLYSGECYVYDPNAVNPGDIIEVTYKPDDPMINFTDYSMPVGYLAD